MSQLVFGIVVNVLRHVFVQLLQGFGIGCIAAPAGNFVVLDASELVVLLPEIGF